ncbi:MAG: hypothetical protein OEM38_01535 [Gammaproteobacteria bacterium]|nr:hypothetical protein [Gammaproteobacteria bacterium]
MKIVLLLLLLILIPVSYPAVAAEGPVVILLSDDSSAYHGPANAFKSKQKVNTLEYNLKGDVENAPAVLREIMLTKPSLIFALGAKAAFFSKIATVGRLETKVIFAMVINWQRYNLLDGQKNIIGISTDIAPGTQLFNLGLLSNNIKKIGVIYSDEYSHEVIIKAKQAASLLGLELVLLPIKQANGFNQAWRKISSSIDAYWVLRDPVLYTMENMHWLIERCLKEKVLCIGQSDNITKLGILLSINPDAANIGVQAASIAKQIINEPTPSTVIRDPIGTNISININTAKKIGLTLNPNVLSMVNEVIGD